MTRFGELNQLIVSRGLAREWDQCYRARVESVLEFLQLSSDDRVLDCGCGRGFYGALIERSGGPRVVSLDAEFSYLTEQLGSAERICSDSHHLPFAAESFGKIICSEVIEHLSDPVLALCELYRVLAPGGTLALTVPNQNYPMLWDPVNWLREHAGVEPIRNGFWSGIWTDHERLYTEELLSTEARTAGFEIDELRPLTWFCLPFAHNLLYGIGKELLLSGKLPTILHGSVDRFGPSNDTSLDLLLPARRVLEWLDELNLLWPPKRESVVLAAKLIKRR